MTQAKASISSSMSPSLRPMSARSLPSTSRVVLVLSAMIRSKSPDTLLCAAGGIGDGRGLAAALMLGADGVLVGSRLWASREANVNDAMHAAALAATGDDTIRSQVMDLARKLDWPSRFTARVLRNRFIERWHGRGWRRSLRTRDRASP